jgi:hypothetical protein
MIEVYWLRCVAADLPDHDRWLSDRERETLDGLRFPKRRADWRLGRFTAKTAIRAAWAALAPGSPVPPIEIVAAPDGAPELRGEDPRRPVLSLPQRRRRPVRGGGCGHASRV